MYIILMSAHRFSIEFPLGRTTPSYHRAAVATMLLQVKQLEQRSNASGMRMRSERLRMKSWGWFLNPNDGELMMIDHANITNICVNLDHLIL